jgi:hypothetical protein
MTNAPLPEQPMRDGVSIKAERSAAPGPAGLETATAECFIN